MKKHITKDSETIFLLGQLVSYVATSQNLKLLPLDCMTLSVLMFIYDSKNVTSNQNNSKNTLNKKKPQSRNSALSLM